MSGLQVVLITIWVVLFLVVGSITVDTAWIVVTITCCTKLIIDAINQRGEK